MLEFRSMKKILTIFVFFIIFFYPNVVTAQSMEGDIKLPNITTTPAPTIAPFVYDLPYPGILPGSFLYNLKAFRDRVMEGLISDPTKKSGFYLLQADKRLSASLMLFDRGENALAETTLSKSQNYLEKALVKAEEVNRLKGRFSETDDKIKLSSGKQIEELEKLIKKIKGETNQRLREDLKRAKEIQKRAEKL